MCKKLTAMVPDDSSSTKGTLDIDKRHYCALSRKLHTESLLWGSDSLKTPLLSWVTIFNVMDFQQRRILGHHIDTGMSSPLTYRRDNLTPLQALLASMLQKVSKGIWDPDASRVQRLDIELGRNGPVTKDFHFFHRLRRNFCVPSNIPLVLSSCDTMCEHVFGVESLHWNDLHAWISAHLLPYSTSA